jgi:hypothetical protein
MSAVLKKAKSVTKAQSHRESMKQPAEGRRQKAENVLD